ncbi:MAG: GNAT family N-acetyltransferase [Xanthobacter sp.]
MTIVQVDIRRATPHDAAAIAAVHDAAWRATYRGIIPGVELERMVERRGPRWWCRAIKRNDLQRNHRCSVLQMGSTVAGYVLSGPNRAISLTRVGGLRLAHQPQEGEIYELYLAPPYQGVGLGQRLFNVARHDLALAGLKGLVVWALAENSAATGFYEALGGHIIAHTTEKFGTKTLDKIAFAWQR